MPLNRLIPLTDSIFLPKDVLDGAMIVLSLFALDVFHPGYFLKGQNVTRRTVNRAVNDDEPGGVSTEEVPLSTIQPKVE